MTQNAFDLTLAQSIVESPDQFPVFFEEAWQWLEFSTKGNAKKSFDKAGFIEDIDFEVFIQNNKNPIGGRPNEIIRLTVDCFKTWAMMVNTEKGKEVRKYFLECEKIAKDKLAQAITKEEDAVKKVKDFNSILDSILEGVNIDRSLIAGLKLNTAKELAPAIAFQLEPARQLIINSSAKQAKLLSVTEIGLAMNPPKKATEVNQLLIQKGYQIKNPNKKSQKDLTYTPTPKAKDYCSVTLATGVNNHTTYQQLRWYDTIITLI